MWISWSVLFWALFSCAYFRSLSMASCKLVSDPWAMSTRHWVSRGTSNQNNIVLVSVVKSAVGSQRTAAARSPCISDRRAWQECAMVM